MSSRDSTLDAVIGDKEKKDIENRRKGKKKIERKSPKKEDSVQLEDLLLDVLRPHEVIRDPVHGDVWINLVERAIIDTHLFQKLRGKLQLGPTHLVYPGATHTRFLHSIGTLYMANEIVDICNENQVKYATPDLLRVDPYERLIIRLFALLHDTAHIPFGHTLEREGNLFENHEWGDRDRADKILGKGSEIRKVIAETLKLYGLRNAQIEMIIKDLYGVLTYDKDNADLMEYKSPFVIDVVTNTLCADLLDYSVRDMYYCGLSERWGDRFLKYLAVLPLSRVMKTTGRGEEPEEFEVKAVEEGGKGRLVLLSYRYERDRNDPKSTRPVRKDDVISEAMDLLRKRYSLAQKVYFHRTKMSASAMIISAIKEAGLTPCELLDMSCEQLLLKLADSSNERASRIAQNFLNRYLYKVVYEIEYKEKREADPDSCKLWDNIYPRFRNARHRIQEESRLEQEMNLGSGDLVIYCPQSGMNAKRFEMLVQVAPGTRVKQLRSILDDTRKEEMRVMDKFFHRLWRLKVLVNPEKLDPQETNKPEVRYLSGLCEEMFDLPNDANKDLRGTKQDLAKVRVHMMAKEWDKKHPDKPAPHFIIEEIEAVAHRYSSDIEALRKNLTDRLRRHYGAD